MLLTTAMMAKTKFDPKPIEDEKPTNYPKPMLLTTAMMAKTVWTETRAHYLRQTNLVKQKPIPEKPMSISNNWQNCKLPQHLCKSKLLWKFFYASYTCLQRLSIFFYKVLHPLATKCLWVYDTKTGQIQHQIHSLYYFTA